MSCYCFLRKIVDEHTVTIKSDESKDKACREANATKQVLATAYKLRFREDFRGPVYNFGALMN